MKSDEMLEFVKALAHADRLRVLGVLAQKAATPGEISTTLGFPMDDVIQHLDMLAKGGIIKETKGSWSLDSKNVEQISKRQFESQPRKTYEPAPDINEKNRTVLAAFLKPDGSIKQLPSDAKKLQIILDYLLEAFSPGVIYNEKEVNMIIRRFHIDTAGLRRDMIDRGMLQRKSDGSQYWRPK
jgi:hypothetical protein